MFGRNNAPANVVHVNAAVMENSFPTKKEFANWLRSKKDKICGFVSQSNSCPLATYFREEKKIPASIYDDYWCLENQFSLVGTRTLPDWAIAFIQEIDESKEPNTPVTAVDALDILEGIRQ